MVSLKQIRAVAKSGADWDDAEGVKDRMRRLKELRTPLYLEPADLAPVLSYKLRQQEARTRKHRRDWSPELVTAITRAAFSVSLANREVELLSRVSILTALPGVGVPVASAILAMAEPERYAIVDFRVWQQIFGRSKRKFSPADYLAYMRKLWPLSEQLGWNPQVVDWCLWRRDQEP